MEVSENVDVRVEIENYLDSKKLTLGWLHRATGFNYHTLYSIITKKKVALKQDKLDKINEVLGTNFIK
jgi:hypothetical protein